MTVVLICIGTFVFGIVVDRGFSRYPFEMDKGGHNDLSRWRQFGGTLERPDPPKAIQRRVE